MRLSPVIAAQKKEDSESADVCPAIPITAPSLLKGHFFQDGNKRTALAVYLDLCQNNGIQIISDQDRLGDVFIDIAATQRDITENARLLFPD